MALFDETVNIQPQTIATGRFDVAMTLAEKLDQFAAESNRFAQEKITEQAIEKGAAEGVAQQRSGKKMQPADEGIFASTGRKAYNQALRESYLKSLDNDNIEEITRIYQENSANLVGFNEAVNSYAAGVMGSVDPSARDAVALSIDSMVARMRPKVQQSEINSNIERANQDMALNAAERSRLAQEAAFDGDAEQAAINLAATIDSIVNRTDLAPEQKAESIREAQRLERESSIGGQLARVTDEKGIQAGYDALDEIADSPPKGFTPEEWNKFVSAEQAKINRKKKRMADKLKEDAEAAKLAALQQRGMLFLDPSVPADPTSKDDRDAVDAAYGLKLQEWSGLPQDQVVKNTIDFVRDSGLVPSSVKSNINAVMRSGTAEQVQVFSDMLGRIQEVSPTAVADIPNETRAISLMVSDGVKAGINLDDALEAARQSAYGLTSSEKETIRLQSMEAAKTLDDSLAKLAGRSIEDGGFDKGILYRMPEMDPAMLGEYRNNFNTFMQLTGGNSEQARQLAFDSIKATWGVTELGGKRKYMKYAPERVYHVPGVGDGWIEEQFIEETEAAGYPGATLAPDYETARSGNPSYVVMVQNPEKGRVEPVMDENNQVLRWRPDFKQTRVFDDLVAAPGEKITKAAERRKLNLERRASYITGQLRRGLILSGVPRAGLDEYMKSEEAKPEIKRNIENLEALGKIDSVEAEEAKRAFGIE